MSQPIFPRLALIGSGLIGSSIALATRKAGAAGGIAINSRSAATLTRAEELGLGDSYHADPAEAAAGADCIIIAVPVGASESIAKAIAGALKPGAIVSDVGSTSATSLTTFTPPALPRPPTCTCALMTTGKPKSAAAFAASVGDVTITSSGQGMPTVRNKAFA